MDMSIFQIESNKVHPQAGSLLISAPFMQDFHFARSVVLVIEHNEEGSMGLLLNKPFHFATVLNDLVPDLKEAPKIRVDKGGPVGRDTLFYLHTLEDLHGAMPLGGGLFLNGDFEQLKRYILNGGALAGQIRFFMGYAGWQNGQLAQEIEANTWLVDSPRKLDITDTLTPDYWQRSMCRMGGKYAVWSRFPLYPTLN